MIAVSTRSGPRVELTSAREVAGIITRGSERIGRREHAEEELLHCAGFSRLRFGQPAEMAFPRDGTDQGHGREGAQCDGRPVPARELGSPDSASYPAGR